MLTTQDFQKLFVSVLKENDPTSLSQQMIGIQNGSLRVGDHTFDLAQGRLWVFGFGKASASMAQGCHLAIGSNIHGGVVICPTTDHYITGKISQLKGNHPIPDIDSLNSTLAMLDELAKVTSGDTVLFLISGGTSSLLCLPEEGIDLRFKQEMFRSLLRSGADISDMNIVRKHLSAVKGGKLLLRLPDSRVINLIISDVPGDDPSVIGSGPTNPDESTIADMFNVIGRYLYEGHLSEADLELLATLPESPKLGDPQLPEVYNFFICTPQKFAQSAAEWAKREWNINQIWVDPNPYKGDVESVVQYIYQSVIDHSSDDGAVKLFSFYGESEIKVMGSGLGGRNQHLALLFGTRVMPYLAARCEVYMLSVGTDGIDGNTDAAGVVINHDTIEQLRNKGLDPNLYLAHFDSHSLFRHTDALIFTNPTGNNLMDLQLLILVPRN